MPVDEPRSAERYRFSPGTMAPLAGFARLDEFQDQSRPYLRSDDGQGYWVFTDQRLIREGLHTPELFSSTAIAPTSPNPRVQWIPINLDNPEHMKWRRVLSPYFAPGRVQSQEDEQRRFARELIEDIASRGRTDFYDSFAKVFPTTIFLRLIGLPVSDLARFLDWEDKILHTSDVVDPDRTIRMGAALEVVDHFREVVAERRANPQTRGDDIVSDAIGWEIDGEPVPEEALVRCLMFLFMAGLDTVTSQLSYSFHHLATHPADRQRLVADPGLASRAVEEFLRAYPIVQTARKVTRDADFHGCPLKAGDMVAFPLGMAGRDPDAYENAREFDLDRTSAPHHSFGTGMHFCLGVHLARQELRIALQEWHALIPDYRLAADVEITEHAGAVFSLDTLPLEW